MVGTAFFFGFCLGVVFMLALSAVTGGLFRDRDDAQAGRCCGHRRHFGSPGDFSNPDDFSVQPENPSTKGAP